MSDAQPWLQNDAEHRLESAQSREARQDRLGVSTYASDAESYYTCQTTSDEPKKAAPKMMEQYIRWRAIYRALHTEGDQAKFPTLGAAVAEAIQALLSEDIYVKNRDKDSAGTILAMDKHLLHPFWGFEKAQGLFPAIHRQYAILAVADKETAKKALPEYPAITISMPGRRFLSIAQKLKNALWAEAPKAIVAIKMPSFKHDELTANGRSMLVDIKRADEYLERIEVIPLWTERGGWSEPSLDAVYGNPF